MLASSIVRHRPVRDYSCCVLDSAFCFRDSSLPAPVVMPSRRDFFNPAEAYVMTLGDGQSKKRVIQLLNQISRFFGAADLHTMEWHMLTYDHVLALRETRVRSGLSPATINLQLSVIKMTCKQCWLKNLMPLQTYAAIKEVKSVRGGRVPKGRALKPAESGRLLKTTEADGDIRSKRDAAIIALALGCGLRRSEIASLLLEQVDHVRHTITVRGKGNKERRVAVADAVWERLAVWLEARAGDPCPNVFLAVRRYGRISTGHSITSSAVYQILKARSSQSGVEDFSPHDLRRTFATRLLGAGTDINLVRKAMGHGPRLRPHHPALRQARGRGGRGGDEKNPHLTQTKRSCPSSGGPFRKLRKAPEHVRTSSAAFRSRACVRLRPRPFPAGCARAPSRRWPWR